MEPTLEDIFGINARYDQGTDSIVIPRANLGIAVVNGAPIVVDPVQVTGALVNSIGTYFSGSVPETVNASATIDQISPTFRNDIERTSFIYTITLFGEFRPSIFNVNDL